MERSGDFVLLMGIYEDTSAACRDYQAVKDLCYEINELDQFDAVVVGRQDTGGLKIFKKPLQPAPYAVWAGAGLGLAAGLVVALVPDAATATGLLEGGAAMVGLGAVAAHVSRGLGRKSLEELGEMLDSSDAALVVAASTTLAGLVRPALVSAEEVRTTPLSVDIDQLGADARAAQREARGDLYPRSDAAMTRT
jgi:hypothetical protein